MKTIGAAKFKEQCLALMDQLDDEGLVITKHGKPVALLKKYPSRFEKYIGSMKDEIKIHADIIDVGDRWVKRRQW